MPFRRLVLAALLSLAPLCWAGAGDPVVKGTLRTTFLLGGNCLTVAAVESERRPGARLEMQPCRDAPEQLFEWNVISFEIRNGGLCVDAFHVSPGGARAGDAVGLWYCNETHRQKWYPARKNERWFDAFNIVSGSPDGALCVSIADPDRVVGAPLNVAACNGGDQQWFRFQTRPPLEGPAS